MGNILSLEKTTLRNTNEIIGDLNRSLVNLQDCYEGLKDSLTVPVERNPFEENPHANVKGLPGIAAEIQAKIEFLKAHI